MDICEVDLASKGRRSTYYSICLPRELNCISHSFHTCTHTVACISNLEQHWASWLHSLYIDWLFFIFLMAIALRLGTSILPILNRTWMLIGTYMACFVLLRETDPFHFKSKFTALHYCVFPRKHQIENQRPWSSLGTVWFCSNGASELSIDCNGLGVDQIRIGWWLYHIRIIFLSRIWIQIRI